MVLIVGRDADSLKAGSVPEEDDASPPTLAADDEQGAAGELPEGNTAEATFAEEPEVTLEQLLERSKISFEAIKGTARKGVVCSSLAKRAGITASETRVQEWENQWIDKLKAAEEAEKRAAPPAPTPQVTIPIEAAMRAAALLPKNNEYPMGESLEPKRKGGRGGGGGGDKESLAKKVFVGGLPNDVDEEELSTIFQRYGHIMDVSVKRDSRNGRSRGFGFVMFATDTDAANAASVQTMMIHGKRVEVQLAVPTGDPSLLTASRAAGWDSGCKVFVGGLAQECTEQHLVQYFSTFGAIASTEIKRDHTNGRSRGFGFVTFSKSSAAENARKAPPIEICGKQVEVLESMVRGDPALESVQRGPDPRRKVFIGGLPQTLTEKELKAVFERFGEVTFSEIKRDFSNDRSRGFGFIIFANEKAAQAALDENAGVGIMIEGKQVEVQETLRKGDPQLASRQPLPAPSDNAPSQSGSHNQNGMVNLSAFASTFTNQDGRVVNLSQLSQLGGQNGQNGQNGQPQHAQMQQGNNVAPPHQQRHMFTQLQSNKDTTSLPGVTPGGNSKIYVGGLTEEITAADLMSTFSLCGEVLSVDVKKDSTGRLKGYAFITFKDPEAASRALNVPNPLVRNKNITVRLPQSNGRSNGSTQGGGSDMNMQDPCVLFVGNLPLEVDSVTLIEEMSLHGPVLSADIPKDPTSGASRGYGYVLFKNAATAEAIASRSKWSVSVKDTPVDIRKVSSARGGQRGFDLAPSNGVNGNGGNGGVPQQNMHQGQAQPAMTSGFTNFGGVLANQGVFANPVNPFQPGLMNIPNGIAMPANNDQMHNMTAMNLAPQSIPSITNLCRLLPLNQ